MLKQRIITAVLLATVVAWALFFWPPQQFGLLLLVATAACAWEWTQLGNLRSQLQRLGYVGVVTAIVAGVIYLRGEFVLKLIVPVAMLIWLYIVVDLRRRPVIALAASGANWKLLALAAFLLVVAVASLYEALVRHSPVYVVYIIAIVAAADIGAYFSGKRFGRNKLAAEISQGKTVEGAIGGIAAAILLALIVIVLPGDVIEPGVLLFGVTVMAALLSIAGDLFISRAKRTVGVKDSGVLLPGHGGVLDRFDGLLAATPWLVFPLLWS